MGLRPPLGGESPPVSFRFRMRERNLLLLSSPQGELSAINRPCSAPSSRALVVSTPSLLECRGSRRSHEINLLNLVSKSGSREALFSSSWIFLQEEGAPLPAQILQVDA